MNASRISVKLATGTPGHDVGQTYLHHGRAYTVRFVRRLSPVGADHFVEELELDTALEAS